MMWTTLSDHLARAAETLVPAIASFSARRSVSTTPVHLDEVREPQPSPDAVELGELAERRACYRWTRPDGLPAAIDVPDRDFHRVPREDRFSPERLASIQANRRRGLLNLSMGRARTRLSRWRSLSDYGRLFANLPRPDTTTTWHLDTEQGRQFLDGVHTVAIRRCAALPPHFPVTDAMVASELGDHATLAEAMAAGHVYMVDYAQLAEIPMWDVDGQRRYAAPAMALFISGAASRTGGTTFRPIAIQLGQEPSEHPVFTPRDTQDWMLAKMHLRCADAQIHQCESHLLRTHLVMEPFYIGMMRELPSRHPVHRLLRPHFRHTVAQNTRGRAILFAPGGIMDRFMACGGGGHVALMKQSYARWRFDASALPVELAARGVDDPEALPGYHYRDDGLKIWGALERFHRAMLARAYPSDAHVREDAALQSWLWAVRHEGHGRHPGDPGIPDHVDTLAQLVAVTTTLAWTCSGQHASQNFQQYRIYAYAPNCPSAMMTPPPTVKGRTTLADVMAALPPRLMTTEQIAITWNLSDLGEDERMLRHYPGPSQRWCDPAELERLGHFHADLDEIEQSIRARNRRLPVPYEALLPSRFTASISL